MIKFRKKVLIYGSWVLMFTSFSTCFGQEHRDSIEFDLDVTFVADRFFSPGDQSIYLPDDIALLRRTSDNGINLPSTQFTDIPQFHASIYTGLLLTTKLADGVKLHTDLYLEDRGQSFGSLQLNKVVVFPRIYGDIDRSFAVRGVAADLKIKVGDLLNYQHNNGMTINNLDAQGIDMKLKLGKLFLQYVLIGDLSFHVGLNLGEFYSAKIGYEQVLRDSTSWQIGYSNDLYINNNPAITRDVIHTLFGKYVAGAVQLKAEVGYRSIAEAFAMMTGVQYTHSQQKRLNWKLDYAIRYFANGFNEGYYDPTSLYRDIQLPIASNNTVGDVLYPLMNTRRSFDQWSLYTEYQGTALLAHHVTSVMQLRLYKPVSLFLDVSLFHILPESQETALYAFYKTGTRLDFFPTFDIDVFITNQLMNLDLHYQTYYQSRQSIFGFSFTRLLDQ